MKIQKLPAEARSKLQSGITVTDAVQCVVELVQNSIDAEATGVAVLIDLKKYHIKVIDNGKGIGKDDLEFVGERFMTSKYQAFVDMDISCPTYGYRGQALSSLQDVSRSLTVETKPQKGGPTFVKVFQQGRALPIREIKSERNGTGTTVSIEDFMYAMPVRRNRINELFDLEEIKNQLQYLAVLHYDVCFTLKNENKGTILLQTPQASNILESIKNIYGKKIANSLTTMHHQEKKYEITGYVSIKSQTQTTLQLVYINRRIIAKGVVHKFVNNLLKKYSRKQNLFIETNAGEIKSLKGSSHNIFVVLIKCPRLLCELFTNVRKTTVEFKNWTEVLKCIHRAVRGAFKSILNLDSSSSQHVENNVEADKGRKRGASVLVNAVKGAAVKRELDWKKDSRKKKKLVLSSKKFKGSLKHDDLKEENQLGSSENHKTETNDTFESPIPKKKIKIMKTNCDSALKKISDRNQSFVEFYEWIKTKLESDKHAFLLYNDFLQFRSNVNHAPGGSEIKSPVLGGKLKGKGIPGPKKKKSETTTKKVVAAFSALDEEMEVVRRNQLKIFPNSHLRVKRGIQFTAEMHSNFPGTLKLGNIRSEVLDFETTGEFMFKKPEGVAVLNGKQRQIQPSPNNSLPSSEVQFTNVIKFRNLSESMLHHPQDTQPVHSEKGLDSFASKSWLSHYQDLVPKKDCVSQKGGPEIPQRNVLEDMFNFSRPSLGFVDFSNKAKEAVTVRHVATQVEILKVLPVRKVDVMVQTFQGVPETPTSGNSAVSAVQNQENNLNQDVPEPDFWNTSQYMEFEQVASLKFVSDVNEIISKNRDTNEKNSTSTEFICGQRSHSSSKPHSERNASKETHTIAAIWTDSLTEMGYPSEKGDTNSNKPHSQDTPLPKTIPKGDIERDISPHAEPGFCLTERHDFVPKGLSPKFINPEPTKISELSPGEKCKVKSTIDNAQNEVLANIKWQDESTGDYLKPKIPDGIFFEMSRRAEEGVINYGDQVLSAALSYYAFKVHNLLHSFTFTKELLSGVEILGQLDRKFIATIIRITTPKKMELISLFDQHAVDERVKLEELINENVLLDGKFISSCLNPPVECRLAESDVRVVSGFREKIENFGLSFELVNENTVLVTRAPTFLLNKHEKDLQNKKETSLSDVLKSLILNILKELTETRGAGSKIPKVLHNAFCLEACHKAIKFNRALSVEKMTEMIKKLRSCNLPFQCAHGRPSVIPIIDLEDFKPEMEEKEKIDLEKLKRFCRERKEDDIIQNSENV